MRPHIRTFVQFAEQAFNLPEPIYEFGSYLVEGQHELANLRPLFAGKEFVGCDMRDGPGVDRVEDLADLSLPDESAGTILCLDTLEHVFHVQKAVDEMIRVLRPGGTIILSAPMDFRIHGFPDDYWRLTPSCVARLLGPLDALLVGSQGLESHPHTVLALGAKAPAASRFPQRANECMASFHAWLMDACQSQTRRKRWKQWLGKLAGSKGDRRKLREFYEARFVMHFTPGVRRRKEELAVW